MRRLPVDTFLRPSKTAYLDIVMTKVKLAKESGLSRVTIDKYLGRGMSEQEIIEEGKRLKSEQAKPETYTEAETRHKIACADKVELENAVKRGELVSVADVNQWVAGMILRGRDVLLRIGPELKDKLALETDPISIEQMIDSEVRRALRSLQEYKR